MMDPFQSKKGPQCTTVLKAILRSCDPLALPLSRTGGGRPMNRNATSDSPLPPAGYRILPVCKIANMQDSQGHSEGMTLAFQHGNTKVSSHVAQNPSFWGAAANVCAKSHWQGTAAQLRRDAGILNVCFSCLRHETLTTNSTLLRTFSGAVSCSTLPLVSIIMPVHNSAEYLPEALTSILSQVGPCALHCTHVPPLLT